MLVDSGAKFTKEVITLDEWLKMRRLRKLGPPRFPYSGLPVMRVAESEGKEGFVLGETTAILEFLDEYLQQGVREAVCTSIRWSVPRKLTGQCSLRYRPEFKCR